MNNLKRYVMFDLLSFLFMVSYLMLAVLFYVTESMITVVFMLIAILGAGLFYMIKYYYGYKFIRGEE